jgi:hypothetical protein
VRKPPTVSQLERKYREFWGQVVVIEEAIVAAGVVGPDLRSRRQPDLDALHAMLGHIEACIRLFEESWTRDQVQSLKPRKPIDPDRWGKLLNWAYDILRAAPAPMTSSEILDQLWRIDKVSAIERDDWRSRLTTLMRGQQKVGAVRSDGRRPLRWSIIKSPGQG